jgi:hypothetical protein
MISRIAHYPASLKMPVAAFLEEPLRAKRTLSKWGRVRQLNETGATTKITKEEAVQGEVAWILTTTSPCVFMAAVVRDGRDEFLEARAGHFSVAFSPAEMDRFLDKSRTPAENTVVRVSGLARRSSRDSLERTTVRIVERVAAFGIPLSLQWEANDRPQLFDSRNGQLVSDLGLGILPQGLLEEDIYVSRIHAFGVADGHSILVNVALEQQGVQRSKPLYVQIITEDVGTIVKPFNLD